MQHIPIKGEIKGSLDSIGGVEDIGYNELAGDTLVSRILLR